MVNIGEQKPTESCGAHFINYETGIKPDIAKGVNVSGVIDCIHKVTIEKDVFTGHDVMILTGSHNYYKFGEDRKKEGGGGPITIKEGAWIASRAMIIGPCTIGEHAVVGAGSVVTHDVPPYTVVAGNPAKEIKKISQVGENKKPVVFYTIGSGKYFTYAKKLQNSFWKFHYNIPFYIYGDKDVEDAKNDGYDWGRNYAYFGSELSELFEKVIHIDADCIVTGDLTEMMSGDWEVAGCLNFGKQYIMDNNLEDQPAIGNVRYDQFLTAGITAVRGDLFWKTWKHATFTKYNNFQGFKDQNPLMIEQDIYNLIFYSDDFKTKVLDGEGSGCYYGTQSKESWNKLSMSNNDILLNGRRVKILHWAGGQSMEKLNYRKDGIPEEVCKRLDYLIS